MSLITEVLIGVAVALLIALGGVGLLYRHEVSKNAVEAANLQTLKTALNALSEQRVLDASTIASLEAAKATETRKSKVVRQATETALQAAPSWSDATVPPGVLAALSDDSGGPNAKAN